MAGEPGDELVEDPYFDRVRDRRDFGIELLREPLSALPVRPLLLLGPDAVVSDAMRAMQREHSGYVLVTDDGTPQTRLTGIFTERDVLLRIVDRGKNPATLRLREVMTADPEVLFVKSRVAYALNKMSVGGFRHVPVVDEEHRPRFVVSVRDIVEFLVEAFPSEVLNLPPESRPSPRAREGA